ncbi:MAG: adenylate/guanylate cyclase domain-containing protein [Xanthobacteraceae bacterium]
MKGQPPQTAASDFHHALTLEILRTEILRIKVMIAVVVFAAVAFTIAYYTSPEFMERIWLNVPSLWQVYALFGSFAIFELFVLTQVNRQIRLGREVPGVRRYLGALLEASLPTAVMALHIDKMGLVHAVAFIAPLFYFVFIILSTLRLDFWLSTFTGLVSGMEYFLVVTFYTGAIAAPGGIEFSPGFQLAHSVVMLIGGILAGAVGAQLRRQFVASITAGTARDRVTNLFGQHVSPQVVERLLAGKSGTESNTGNVAVMFVDIRGFTAAARQRQPADVVKRLDDAFAILVDIVDRNHGIVNKFLGDGFLALFGAPIHDPSAAMHAVTASREMLDAIARDNDGHHWPLRIGIGIHYGIVVAGNVGSPRRKEYTVIGDTVNCAARIEALNKDFGSQIIVSDAIYQAIGPESAAADSLGDVVIRGYEQPMPLWRLA